MTDPNKLFADLMQNWTQAQEQAWQLQSKMMKDAGEAFAAPPQEEPGDEDRTPFDEAWSRAREAFDQWNRYIADAAPAGPEGGFGAEMLSHLMDPGSWLNVGISELNQTLESLAEGAQFANLWRTEREVMQASREWLELRQQSLRYRAIIMAAWLRAYERFYDKMHRDIRDDAKPAADWQGLMGVWLDIANEELLKTQRSEEFLTAQRDLLRASIDFRAYQQRFVEQFCEANAMPTRSEVDDLHRTVTELRREMRALKAELSAARAKKPKRPRKKPAPRKASGA